MTNINLSQLIGHAKSLTILVLLLIIFFMRECSPSPDCPEVKTETITKIIPGDSVPYPVYIPRPYPLPADTFIVEVPADVDTGVILKDYFTKYYYSDTIKGEEFVAIIKDTITQNRISSRKMDFQNLKPTTITTITNTVENPPRNKIFAGIMAAGNIDGFGAGASLMLLTKKDNAYSYTYDLVNNEHMLTFYLKLRLRK